MRNTTRGQSTVEYVVVVAVVIAALLASTIYSKRAKMGDLGRATDQVGQQFNPHQYASKFNTSYGVTRIETREFNGLSKSAIKLTTEEKQSRDGAERLTQSRQKCEQLFFQTPTGAEDLDCPAPLPADPPGDAPIPDDF
jgi:hypothetical protein